MVQVCLLFCLGETLVLVGVCQYVFWYSLILDRSESDGVRRVPSEWRWQCVGQLFDRLMESLLFVSFGLRLSWSGLRRTCLVGCGLRF